MDLPGRTSVLSAEHLPPTQYIPSSVKTHPYITVLGEKKLMRIWKSAVPFLRRWPWSHSVQTDFVNALNGIELDLNVLNSVLDGDPGV